MDDYKKLALVKKDVNKLSLEEVKRRLAEEFNYNSKFLYYVDEGRVYDELVYCIMESDPYCSMSFPHTDAGLPDGTSIMRFGDTFVDPYVALIIGHGYTHEQVQALESPYEEWCRVTRTPLDPEYVKRKERKLKRKQKQDEKNNIVRLQVKPFKG